MEELESKLKKLTSDYDDLQVQRNSLFDQIDEWMKKGIEWDETRKSLLASKYEVEKKYNLSFFPLITY